ncbi:MAG TPA: prephenate dehydrogenase/arogenate dehydrogenase family protein [Blastocatellia bacterium]|jgi:prephenate dehydrogenase
MRFDHIAIVGVGLIGGSFALAARRAGLAERITGLDSKAVIDKARARGVIDDGGETFEEARVARADLVYLAAPVGAILSFLRSNGPSLKPGAIVTDAGSTKRDICRAAREALPPEIVFVGGHPMAGSERTGVEFADANLFSGAPYALIADRNEPEDGLHMMTEVVESVGAHPVVLTAEQHDRIAARISHVPQLLSTALALAVSQAPQPETLRMVGSGFAELARLAESRWSVWEDICRTNADEISSALDEAISELEAVQAAVLSRDFSALEEMFEKAAELMRRFREMRRDK